MNKSVIILGIALAVFTNTNAAASKNEAKATAVIATAIENEQGDAFQSEGIDKSNLVLVPDQEVLNPETVLTANNQKAIEMVIAENNQITESTVNNDGYLLFVEKPVEEIIAEDNKVIESNISAEVRPLYLDRTLEDVIAEDNAIIEGDTPQAQPLDFDSINKKQIAKEANIKILVGMN
jgi:hypothetical protein